jgi:hypothetical protein
MQGPADTSFVMPGLVPGIHALLAELLSRKPWVASPTPTPTHNKPFSRLLMM